MRDTPSPYPAWSFDHNDVRARFLGRGPDPRVERRLALAAAVDNPPRVAWAKQVHGNQVLEARPGYCGEGDALVSDQTNLALSVITADCVPLLMAGDHRLAAVHAGWRGLVSGVIGAALERFDQPPRVWIGPAIGACCYEVSDDVAAQVADSADPSVIHQTRGPKPHLDLSRTARIQLELAGVEQLEQVDRCTLCHPEELWSYRREGPGAGRNIAYIWRESRRSNQE